LVSYLQFSYYRNSKHPEYNQIGNKEPPKIGIMDQTTRKPKRCKEATYSYTNKIHKHLKWLVRVLI